MKNWIYFIIILLSISACDFGTKNRKKDTRIFVEEPSVNDMYELYGKEEYLRLYNIINDSIKNRRKNGFVFSKSYYCEAKFDSILFINKKKDFIIGNEIRMYKDSNSWDAHQQLFARKFNGNWYINYGASQSVSENSSYSEVHEVILKDISRRIYRKTPKGKLYVKEEMFENDGYSDRGLKKSVSKMNYPDSKHEWNYQQYFVEMSINTYYKETYWQMQYLPENYSFSYSKSKKELTVTAKIPYWHDFPLDHIACWLDKTETRMNSWNSLEIIRKGQQYSIRKYKDILPNQEIDLLFHNSMQPNPPGMESAFYRFKLTNGKVRFVKLVPHERGLQDYATSTHPLEKLRSEWQKIIDETYGKDYGKNSKIRSVVVD